MPTGESLHAVPEQVCECCSTFLRVAVHCSVLQYVPVCCSAVQCVAVTCMCRVPQCFFGRVGHRLAALGAVG